MDMKMPYSSDNLLVKQLHNVIELYRFELEAESCPVPTHHQIAYALNTAFWASLRTEEGEKVFVALALAEPRELIEEVHEFILFDHHLLCSVEMLVKLSPLLGTDDETHLGITFKPDSYWPVIWGIKRGTSGLTIRIVKPGHIVVYLNREILADIQPGTDTRIFGPDAPVWVSQVGFFVKRCGFPSYRCDHMTFRLQYLAKSMRHGRGGTLLLVPPEDTTWKSSLDIKYPVFNDGFGLEKKDQDWNLESEQDTMEMRAKLGIPQGGPVIMTKGTQKERDFRKIVQSIGKITAVDGATVLSMEDFSLIGFGAKILSNSIPPETLNQFDSHTIDMPAETISLTDIGGTRHRSAVQFVHDNPGTLAVVASMDDRITLFAKTDTVDALQCESLLR